jgi:predicted small metal-binding protein
MTKKLHCRDVGFDCDAVVTADTDEEIVRQVAEHARGVHHLTEEQLADPQLLDQVRLQIREQTDPV